jgi:hypothetical protein
MPHRRDVSLVERVFNFSEVLGANLADLRFLVGSLGGSTEEALLRVYFASVMFIMTSRS